MMQTNGSTEDENGMLLRPEEIEARSFAIIDREVPTPRPFEGRAWAVVRRMIHTTADFDMPALVRFHPDAVAVGVGALRRGCLIVTDTHMARMGVTHRRMDRLGCEVACYVDAPEAAQRAVREGITRSVAAVDLAAPHIDGGIWVVGNAPTALLRILEWLSGGRCRPALVVGMPVGFVNAAESKDRLMNQAEVPYISLCGRKGGSALAACVVNQLAEFALEEAP